MQLGFFPQQNPEYLREPLQPGSNLMIKAGILML
jgi:hypothetical protein